MNKILMLAMIAFMSGCSDVGYLKVDYIKVGDCLVNKYEYNTRILYRVTEIGKYSVVADESLSDNKIVPNVIVFARDITQMTKTDCWKTFDAP